MKRALALILCLMLLPAALAETWVVSYYNEENNDYSQFLIRDDGRVLVEPFTYCELYELTPDGTPDDQCRYAASERILMDRALSEEELWDLDQREYVRTALLDAKGRPLTGFDYYWLRWMDGVLVFVTPQGYCGAMDTDGNILVEAKYFDVVPNGEGGWLAMGRDGDTEVSYDHYYPVIYIDPRGREHETGFHAQYGGLDGDGFSDGYCPLRWVREFGDRCIYLTPDGAWAHEGAYDYIEAFHSGVAAVSIDGDGYVLIDETGNCLTEQYDYFEYVEYGGEAVYSANRSGAFAMFDASTGQVRRYNSYPGEDWVNAWSCGTGLIGVSVDGEVEVYALSGALMFCYDDAGYLSAWYREADSMPERFALNEGDWPYTTARLVDTRGREVGGEYQSMTPEIWRDGQARFLTESYGIKKNDGYDYVDWETMRYGVCDGEGREILPCRYQTLQALSLDRYWVRQGSRSGLIDSNGNWLYTIDDYQFLLD